MITFLRKIRQSLLQENRLSKYLLYALGEILLVVIGILIALQINTWNDYRNDRKTEKEYILRLQNELISDIEYYKLIRERFIEKKNRLENIIKIWQSDNPILEDSLQYINDYKNAGNISIWYNKPITWTQMVQTGDLKLITDPKLVEALFLYYNSLEKAAENYALHPMDMTNKAREIMHRPFIYQNLNDYWKEAEEKPNDQVYALIWENKATFLDLFFKIALVSEIQANTLEGIIKSGEELIDKLKSKK